MRVDQRRGVGIEIDDQRRQQHLPLDPALLALKLEPLIDDALMRRVLVDDDDAVSGLGDDVVLVHLRPRRAKRSGEVALAWPRPPAPARRARLRRSSLARARRAAAPRARRASPSGENRTLRGTFAGDAWRGSSPSRRWSRRDASASFRRCLIAPTIRPRMAAASRKRTSALAGWTLTSTSSARIRRTKPRPRAGRGAGNRDTRPERAGERLVAHRATVDEQELLRGVRSAVGRQAHPAGEPSAVAPRVERDRIRAKSSPSAWRSRSVKPASPAPRLASRSSSPGRS